MKNAQKMIASLKLVPYIGRTSYFCSARCLHKFLDEKIWS